jgi:uncharacterized repeat protein (TIGR01451 family)
VGSTNVPPATSFGVPLTIDSGTIVLGQVLAEISYDPAVVQFVGVTQGTTEFETFLATTNSPTTIRVLAQNANSTVSPSGFILVATINFTAIGGVGTSSQLNFLNFEILDTDVNTVNTDATSGLITIAQDQQPCVLTCPNNIVVNANGTCSAVVNYSAPTPSGDCGTVTCAPISGSTFQLGATTVNCTSATGGGACSFSVTVEDNTPPNITCPGNITVDANANCQAVVNYSAPTVTDNCSISNVVCSPASGSTFSLGQTTVSCTATDNAGNTGLCSFSVTVVDNTAPQLTACPANIVTNTSAGLCARDVSFPAPTATDNCDGSRTVTCAPASGSSFGLGQTTVTCSASDTHGNTNSCSFTVTINDTQAPIITCPGNITSNVAGGVTSAIVTYETPSATDNCSSNVGVNCAPPSGSTFALGTTNVTCTATDTANNTGSCSFSVTVAGPGDQQPVALCTNVTKSADANCEATVTADEVDNGSNDPDGGDVSVSVAPTGPFGLGATNVTLTVVDDEGNTNTCVATVTVVDTTAPSITCPSNITANADSGQCSAVVNFAASATDNCDASPTVVCTPASGSSFPVGLTAVNCTATDASSNSNSCSFNVTVSDTEAPTATCPVSIVTNVASGVTSAILTYTATASDNCPGATIECTPASGSSFSLGTTTVNCTATDASSNTGGCSFNVTVAGPEPVPPVAICVDVTNSANASCEANVTAEDVDNGSFDPDGGPVTLSLSPSGPFGLGTTPVTLTVVDDENTTNTCTANVTVVDTTPPSVTCPADINADVAAGTCAATVSFETPTGSDNCDTAVAVVCVPASGSSFAAGTNNVTCTATDDANNSAQCSFNVIVSDNEDPSITCPADVNANTAAGTCAATVGYSDPSATDNCGTPSVVCVPSSGSSFAVGTNSVTCTATDAAGNSAQCMFNVIVSDNEAPVITCPADITRNVGVGETSAVVEYTTPTPTDNCPGAGASCEPISGSSFPLGTNAVTCTATDAAGNTANCSFHIIVTQAAPEADLIAAKSAEPSQVNVGSNLTYTVTVSNAGPSDATSVVIEDTLPDGVTLGSVDGGSATCITNGSVIECELDSLSAGSSATITIGVVPTQEGVITNTVSVSSSVTDPNPANNSAEAVVTVVPAGMNAPVAQCKDVTKSADANCQAAVTAAEVDNGSFDPDNDPISLSLEPPGPFTVGSNAVTLVVVDSTGLSNTCSATVFVTDDTAPSITCPANIIVTAAPPAVVTFNASASDNCPGVGVVCAPASGSSFPMGTTTVDCTATDGSGNTATCAFSVTVVPPTGDSDGDGVPDGRDDCPNTPPGEIVNSDGCSIAQLVPCDGPREGGTWKNHGQYVKSIVRTVKAFDRAGLITREERIQILVNAARSDCGRAAGDSSE